LRVSPKLHDHIANVVLVSVGVDDRGGFYWEAVYFFLPDLLVQKEISRELPYEEDYTAIELVASQEQSLNVLEDIALGLGKALLFRLDVNELRKLEKVATERGFQIFKLNVTLFFISNSSNLFVVFHVVVALVG